jgi:uncharacterized NAD-dependent epimerase/dehydratase family protein
VDWVQIPNLRDLATLYEDLAEVCGTFPRPRTVAVSLITAGLDTDLAERELQRVASETCLPTSDPVREGGKILLDAVMADESAARPDPG